mgnify:CR=1 FL=1
MKIFCVSLGCDKNLVDTEMMLGLLNKDGYTFTDDEHEADVVVVNTCCFIGDAKEESVNTILEMAELKKEGRCKALIVTGCMAQRYKQEILDEIPEVDGILGTSTYDEISNVLKKVLGGSRESCFHDLNALPNVEVPRVVTTGGYYAFLKIAEGCDKRCTYCIIPDLRGSYRSVPMEDLVAQAKEQGYVETLFHRRRELPEIRSSNFNLRSFGERVALNMPIQGTAADIMKLAMVAVERRLKEELPSAKLVLQVHDELIVECREEQAEAAARMLEEEMEQVVSLSVPLTAEAHWGKNWLEAKG